MGCGRHATLLQRSFIPLDEASLRHQRAPRLERQYGLRGVSRIRFAGPLHGIMPYSSSAMSVMWLQKISIEPDHGAPYAQ